MRTRRSRWRVMFSFWDGGRGHVTRTILLARAARERGAHVGIVTSRKFAADLRATAAAHEYFLIENRPTTRGRPYPMPVYSHAHRHAQRLRGLGFDDGTWVLETTRREVEAIRAFRPDLIVNDYRDTIRSAAQLVGVPVVGITHATGNTGGAAMGSWSPPPSDAVLPDCRDSFNLSREILGLPPIDDERVMFEGDISIVPSTPELDPLPYSAVNTRFVGLISAPTAQAGPKPALNGARFNVYCYVGEPTRPRFGFERLIDQVVASLPDVGFYLVGDADAYPGEVIRRRRAEGSVVLERFMPAAATIADSAAVLCHGGNSTVMLALTLGKPVICVGPYHSDCAAAFRAVQSAGAGIRLDHSHGPLERRAAPDLGRGVEIFGHWRSELTAGELTEAITAVTADDTYAFHARRLGRDLLAYGGADRLLDILRRY